MRRSTAHSPIYPSSKRLEEKWEQRFDTLAVARLARVAGVRYEDIETVRRQPW
jgi:hypothetical protein